MKKLLGMFCTIVTVSGAVPLIARSSTPAQQGGGITQVTCNGLICGGTGGSSSSQFLYRVKPASGVPTGISSLEVGVEDGDLTHYTNFVRPNNWIVTTAATSRSHDLLPTCHGTVTSSSGTCPVVLKFSKGSLGTAQTQPFDIGYSYTLAGSAYHDANWKTSDGRQSGWSFPVGTNSGPVHTPVPRSNMNVLLIVLDDVGTDKVALFDDPTHTHPFARTPNLDNLAACGIKFTNCYVNPVCSTSRACIQTGRYAFRHGIGALTSSFGLADSEVTFAELLKAGFPPAQSYACGAFGKWHMKASATHAVDNGYDRFYGTLANTGDHFTDWVKIENDPQNVPPLRTICFSCPTETDPCPPCTECLSPCSACTTCNWTAEVVRADAETWINAQTKPFFGYVAFNPPHAAFEVPPFTTGDGRPLVSPETQLELASYSPNPIPAEANYRAMLEAVDSEIAYLLDDITPAKRRNTVVFVVADNGTPGTTTPGDSIILPPHNPDHGKATLYQLAVRVPMIVSGPVVTPGVCTAAVGAVDLWRTIAEITGADENLAFTNLGITPPPVIDSLSFFPLLQNPSGPAGRFAFSQGFTPNGVMDTCSFHCLTKHGRAVTDGVYKYIRTLDVNAPPCHIAIPGCVPCDEPCTYLHEFYKVDTDPEETTNLLLGTLTQEQTAIFNAMSDYMHQLSDF